MVDGVGGDRGGVKRRRIGRKFDLRLGGCVIQSCGFNVGGSREILLMSKVEAGRNGTVCGSRRRRRKDWLWR